MIFIYGSIPIFAQCPTWSDCVSLVSSDGCTHTFIINIEGDSDFSNSSNPIGIVAINWNFSLIGNGEIVSANHITSNTELATQGVIVINTATTVNVNHFGATINSGLIIGDQIVVVVETEPFEQITFGRTGINSIYSPSISVCMASSTCTLPTKISDSAMSSGESISGLITAFSATTANCPDTQNLGIEGAEVTIVGANGSCTSSSQNNGLYSCDVCEDGPYEVCVETTCDKSCDVTTLDLVLLQQMLLGLKDFGHEYQIMGDVNMNGTNSVTDLLTIRKDILGLESNVDNWCRFVAVEDCNSFVAGNMGLSDIDNCVSVPDGTHSVDFIRFMLGDINGGCDDCIHGDGIGQIPIVTTDDGDNSYHVKFGNNTDIAAFGLSFEIPTNTIISNVTSSTFDIEYNIVDDVLKVIWLADGSNSLYNEVTTNTDLFVIDYQGSNNITIDSEDSYMLSPNDGVQQIVNSTLKRNVTKQPKRIINVGNLSTFQLIGNSDYLDIQVLDLSGRLLDTRHMESINPYIDYVPRYNTGLYILRVRDAYNDISKKIILQN
ncbi:MAG: T9SS type A sorting domain-containing protein [Saprospiraceae bacterium]